MTYRVRNIVVAVGLALVAALLTTFYVANYKRHVQASESTVTVFVAKKDIPQGTPGADLVRHGWIGPAQVVSRTVVPGAISDPDQIRGLLTRADIYQGEQVSLRRFADGAEQGVRVQLHGQVRAVSIPGSADALLAGTLRDGDHVDLIANLKTGDCGSCTAVRDVAQNLLVLHAPAAPSGSGVASGQQESVLLAVSDRKEAQKVWFAVENSSGWSLTLRPVAGATNPPIDIETMTSILHDGAPASALSKLTGGSN